MKKLLFALTFLTAILTVSAVQAKGAFANRQVNRSMPVFTATDPSTTASSVTAYFPCSPACLEQIKIDKRVHNVAELDVFKFMQTAIHSGRAMIVDTRRPEQHKRGTIPDSINIPYTTFEKPLSDKSLVRVLEQLGGVKRNHVNPLLRLVEKLGLFQGNDKTDQWDFSQAKEVLLWCDNAHCNQSPRAIKGLLKAGYPADKISYYRAGMKMWQTLGLKIIVPHTMRIASN